MEISAKKLKGFKIYNHEASKPFGIVTDVWLDTELTKIVALTAETISIIPISKIISFDSINNICNGSIILKKNTVAKNVDRSNAECANLSFEKIKKAIDPRLHSKKVRDVKFDFETGEMTDIVISDNIFSKKSRICSKNICLRNNTIYINK